MKLIRTLYAAAAVSAFALPAAAQDMTSDPAPGTPPVAQDTAQPATAPASNQQPEAPATMAPGQQPMAQTAPAATPQAAAAADLTVGAQVFDAQGQEVGTIAEADAAGAVVSTGTAQGRMNLDAFYKNERGLMIGYSKAQFEALVTGMGGPETPDAEETAQPVAPEQQAAQPDAAAPEQPER